MLLGVFAAVAAWVIVPIFRPEFVQVWFVGAGDWQGIVLKGRDVVSLGFGLLVWIAALHVPRRGQVIAGIRVGSNARNEFETSVA